MLRYNAPETAKPRRGAACLRGTTAFVLYHERSNSAREASNAASEVQNMVVFDTLHGGLSLASETRCGVASAY
jgi:hypothetical protein